VAIELDGARHFSITMDEYERSRTRYLEEIVITIVRFENHDLLENLEGVLEKIKEALQGVGRLVSDHPVCVEQGCFAIFLGPRSLPSLARGISIDSSIFDS